MRGGFSWRRRALKLFALTGLSTGGIVTGCGGPGANFEFFGTPYYLIGSRATGRQEPSTTGRTTGAGLATGALAPTDPCEETQPRKFVRISMRNLSPDYIHYFLILVAFVNSDTYPDGAVCPTDQALYTAFGYILVPAGATRALGDYCIRGPALYYVHRGGQFHGAGAQGLASAIAPAQGTTASYDAFFNANGQQVPIPNWILFHNPGTTTEGRALKVSQSSPDPCTEVALLADPLCEQDAFYYVDERDIRAGSTVRGAGAYVRVPSDIQGTGCQCAISNEGYAILAPSSATAANAQCNWFFRGGRIDFAFVRDDTEPPFPQLVWRVTDSSGARAHNFDPRARIP